MEERLKIIGFDFIGSRSLDNHDHIMFLFYYFFIIIIIIKK